MRLAPGRTRTILGRPPGRLWPRMPPWIHRARDGVKTVAEGVWEVRDHLEAGLDDEGAGRSLVPTRASAPLG